MAASDPCCGERVAFGYITNRHVTTHERDWEQHARIHRALARIHSHHGDCVAARAALLKAEELFERMGLAGERLDAPLSFAAHTPSPEP